MKDFGNDAFSGYCFDIVGKIKGLNCNNSTDFIEILHVINRDLSLGIDENGASFAVPVSSPENKPKKQPENVPIPTPKKTKPYSVVPQSFSTRELSFWGQYGITPELLKMYKVVALLEFKSENSEGKPFTFYSTDNEPVFGYQGKRKLATKPLKTFHSLRFTSCKNPKVAW
jgi:hypothetical protein